MKVIKFNKLITFKRRSIIHKSIITYDYKLTFNIYFVKNGKIHNSKKPAEIEYNKINNFKHQFYYLYGTFYNRTVNNNSWKKYAKDIIRKNKLNIFK